MLYLSGMLLIRRSVKSDQTVRIGGTRKIL